MKNCKLVLNPIAFCFKSVGSKLQLNDMTTIRLHDSLSYTHFCKTNLSQLPTPRKGPFILPILVEENTSYLINFRLGRKYSTP